MALSFLSMSLYSVSFASSVDSFISTVLLLHPHIPRGLIYKGCQCPGQAAALSLPRPVWFRSFCRPATSLSCPYCRIYICLTSRRGPGVPDAVSMLPSRPSWVSCERLAFRVLHHSSLYVSSFSVSFRCLFCCLSFCSQHRRVQAVFVFCGGGSFVGGIHSQYLILSPFWALCRGHSGRRGDAVDMHVWQNCSSHFMPFKPTLAKEQSSTLAVSFLPLVFLL